MDLNHLSLDKRRTPDSDLRLLQADFRCVSSGPEHSTVLLVDASTARLLHIANILQQDHRCFIQSRSVSEALHLLRRQRVDLVIADLEAPGDGASALCHFIRRSSRDTLLPVIVVSRNGDTDAEVMALEAGADTVLPSTAPNKTWKACISTALRRKKEIDALDETGTVLFTLAQSVEERDPALGRHCERLALMGAAMGVALGLEPEDILALQRGGYLHDVGKVAIPDSVLFKPGPLTPDEWVQMKSHAERGERICSKVRSLGAVLPIIRHHHERWDGSGYPDRLSGEQIPLLARIIQFADIYDALTTARPYKRAFTSAEAVAIMREETEKGWRDPKLMQVFLELAPFFESTDKMELSEIGLQSLARAVEHFRKRPKARPDAPRHSVLMASGQ